MLTPCSKQQKSPAFQQGPFGSLETLPENLKRLLFLAVQTI
jgi:hypothetical protein